VGVRGLALSLPPEVLDALVDELAARLEARGAPAAPAAPVVYTVATLAAELQVSPKVVRGAIARGELVAAQRSGRYLISDDAVRAWATPDAPAPRRAPRAAPARPMGSAMAAIDGRRPARVGSRA